MLGILVQQKEAGGGARPGAYMTDDLFLELAWEVDEVAGGRFGVQGLDARRICRRGHIAGLNVHAVGGAQPKWRGEGWRYAEMRWSAVVRRVEVVVEIISPGVDVLCAGYKARWRRTNKRSKQKPVPGPYLV